MSMNESRVFLFCPTLFDHLFNFRVIEDVSLHKDKMNTGEKA